MQITMSVLRRGKELKIVSNIIAVMDQDSVASHGFCYCQREEKRTTRPSVLIKRVYEQILDA